MDKTVWLLYEGDEWLSTDSLVLMGVFSSRTKLNKAANMLIRQREREHLKDAIGNCYDFIDCKTDKQKTEFVCNDILDELMNIGSTSGWTTNYMASSVTLDELGEVL